MPGSQAERAERLRALHHDREPLILPNAWDAASAHAVVEAGFPAVATTSSGMAGSLGWADGEHTPPDEMFAAIGRIGRELAVPLTADIESGYGLSPAEVARRLIASGAAGCNFEDSDHARPGTLRDAAEQAGRIRELKQASRELGVDLVVNARIDVFLRAGSEIGENVVEATRRAGIYLDAGADCVFPILVRGESVIAALAKGISGPVNILALPGGPALSRLRELGVARISFGGRLQQEALADHCRRLAAIRHGNEIWPG